MLPLSVLSVLENITAFASRENMVFGKFRRLNFLSTVPAIVVALYLCKVVFEQIMYIPSTFFICLESFGTNHIPLTISLILTCIAGKGVRLGERTVRAVSHTVCLFGLRKEGPLIVPLFGSLHAI